MWLIAGLGNPGSEYEATRHNLGFAVVDELSRRSAAQFARTKITGALVARTRIGVLPGGAPGPGALLLKPQNFMNRSGAAVSHVAQYFHIEPSKVIVVHDDLDLDFARIKLRCGGGEGGHNGLRDISRALATREYLRVRIGIGRPPGRQDPVKYVLGRFPAAQASEVALVVSQAADAVTDILTHGLQQAQLQWHTA